MPVLGHLSPLGFMGVPDLVKLDEPNLPKFLAARLELHFNSAEPRHELIGGVLQNRFRIQLGFTREVDDREQKVPNLIGKRLRVPGFDRFLCFREFLVNFCDHVGHFDPIKIDSRRFFLRFLRAHQGGEGDRKVGEVGPAAGILFFALDRFPLFHDTFGISDAALAENMRVPPDQFGRHFRENFADAEASALVRNLRMHDGKQDQIAQFLAKILVVSSPNRARDFISLLDQAREKRLVRLLTVPWTASRGAQFCHNLAKLREIAGWSLQIFHNDLWVRNSETSPVVFLLT